jgi:hypothetical protein
MEDSRFNVWTRRQVGLVAGGVIAGWLGGIPSQEAGAKKRRKKKRKKPPREMCRRLRDECENAAEEQCCGALVCDENTCVGDPVCVQPAGGSCRDRCDCRLGLECSSRANNTCRQCALLQTPCDEHDDCCLGTAACGSTIFATNVCCQQLGGACGLDSDCCANSGKCGLNGCGGVEPVCCKGVGLPCEGNCDCCDPRRCVSGTCQ